MIDEVNAAAQLIVSYLTCPIRSEPVTSLEAPPDPDDASISSLSALASSSARWLASKAKNGGNADERVIGSSSPEASSHIKYTQQANNSQSNDEINESYKANCKEKTTASCQAQVLLGGESEKEKEPQLTSYSLRCVGSLGCVESNQSDEKKQNSEERRGAVHDEDGREKEALQLDADDQLLSDVVDVDNDLSSLSGQRRRQRQCNLVESISLALQAKFKGHWYPCSPSKGSGYRCLKFGAQYLDGAIVSACQCCGIDRAEIITSIPNDLILWIDPGEVSYKIGDSVPLTTVYSKQQVDSTTSCQGKGGSTCTNGIISSNPSLRNYFMPDGNQDQHLACKVDKFVSVSDKSCSPIAGAGRASPFLGPGSTAVMPVQGSLLSPMYSNHLEGASDLNNNNINLCQYERSAAPAASNQPQALAAAAAALCNFNKTALMMTSQPFVSSACMNMKMADTISSHSSHANSPFKQAANKLSHLSRHVNSAHPVNSVEVVNGIGVGPGCLYPGATTAELSSPSPPVVNGTGSGLSVEESVQHLSPHHSLSLGHSLNGGCGDSAPLITGLGMGVGVGAGPPHTSLQLGGAGHLGGSSNGLTASGRAAVYGTGTGGVHERPTTLPGVGLGGLINKNNQRDLLSQQQHQSSPINNSSCSSISGRSHHFVPRNFATGSGSHRPKRGARFSAGCCAHSMSHSHSLSFASLNPEAAVFSPTDSPELQLTNVSSTSAVPPPQVVAVSGGATGSEYSAEAPEFMSPNLSTTSVNAGVSSGGGPSYNRVMAGNNNSNICGSNSKNQQTAASFQAAAATIAINQLQFHQQAFRGGSPVDYGHFYNSNIRSSSCLLKNNNNNVVSSVSPKNNNNSCQSPIQNPLTSSSTAASNSFSGGGERVSPALSTSSIGVVVTANGGSPSPTGSVTSATGAPGGTVHTPSSKNSNNNSHSANAIMTPSTSISGGPSASTSAVNNSPLTSNHNHGGTSGANQQLMTADAFAATKFGSTKLKSRKSNINLSQMSPTQFEAYMRHKTSTMHSRPPHTNYTDAYPASSSSCSPYGGQTPGCGPSNSLHSLQNAAVGGNPTAAHCYFGPIRAGSSGSSTSSPSPGSFPGFPSPSMVMELPVGVGALSSRGGHRAAASVGMHSHNLEQGIHDLCDDPFFQPSGNGAYQIPPAVNMGHSSATGSQQLNGGVAAGTCNSNNNSNLLGVLSNSHNSSHNHFLHLDASSLANLTSSAAAAAAAMKPGAGLGPIGGVVNTRGGAISRGGVEAAEFGGGWNSFCGMGTTGRRAANGLAPCSTSRFDQQQQFVPSPSPSVPGVIGSSIPTCSGSVGGADNGAKSGLNNKTSDTATNNLAPTASSCAESTEPISTSANCSNNNLVSGASSDSSNISYISAVRHSKVTTGFLSPFPSITQASRVDAN